MSTNNKWLYDLFINEAKAVLGEKITDADKEEIADAAIDALPKAEEDVY